MRIFKDALETGEIRTPGQIHDAILRAILIGSVRMNGLRKPERSAAKAVRTAMDAATDSFTGVMQRRGERWVNDAHTQRVAFEARLEERWHEALMLCELMRIVCLEAGIEYHRAHQSDENQPRHYALAKLHARACLIAAEILALLRSGFASGAHARWRAMHEVAVIGSFLADRDDDLSIRYLEYEHVESLAAARDYQENAEDLGYEPMTDEEFNELQARVDEQCEKYGPLFKKRYGWASHLFGSAPDYKTIEQATDLSHYRSYYRMASHPVHAGPKGITFDIGLLDKQSGMMLAGPSNAGLADPGHGMCISLSQITTSFLTLEPRAGSVVTLKIILSLSERAGRALIDAHRKLEEDDIEARKDEYDPAAPDGAG